MELRRPAHGAQVRRVNSLRRYARRLELPPVGGRQVDVRFPLPSEARRHLRTYLITAWTDSGPEGCVQITRLGGETSAHGVHRVGPNLSGRAPTAGTHGRYRALFGV